MDLIAIIQITERSSRPGEIRGSAAEGFSGSTVEWGLLILTALLVIASVVAVLLMNRARAHKYSYYVHDEGEAQGNLSPAAKIGGRPSAEASD